MLKKSDMLMFTRKAAQAADAKLGQDILVLDVSKESSLADYFVFVTGTTHTHIRAMEDAVREALKSSGAQLTRTDGQRGHVWRVLDYGGLIMHLMDAKTRQFYAIEKLWERGRPVEWEIKKPVAAKAPSKKAPASKAPARKAPAGKKPVRKGAARRKPARAAAGRRKKK